ncbi:MAG: NADH-quinone oxidoreductase subunit C [Candidatus Accumulibacter sp.]|jgi:Ni,Fe-hydrogenase III large subunit/Ni,Fe-hydrogenase III component G|nr:NADH-quinone oxidoreductase subunit C [Accumulibacter sp.]
MLFLDQPLEFTRVEGGDALAYTARADFEAFGEFALAAYESGRRLVALWGGDERDAETPGIAVCAAFDLPEGLACVKLVCPVEDAVFPDLSGFFPAADRMQRAVRDLVGAAPRGGDLRPWLRHANWPADYFPLRSDAPEARFDTANENYEFVRVGGDGVHEIAVGPIHAGIIEPGHFRFSVMGESVLRLEERLGWKHKGIERRFSGMSLADGLKLAGRVSGDSTVAYAWAYSQAAEMICGVTAPPRAAWLRALFLERERVANHLGDLGYLGNDVALSFGLMQFMRIKEDWLRLNARLFGHRFMMDKIVPGGVTVDLDDAGVAEVVEQCRTTERDVHRLKDVYEEHAGLQDRFLTTGRVTPELAKRLGAVGVAARASGQCVDLRADHPVSPYDRVKPVVAMEERGDVAARALVRFAEIDESLRLIRALVDGLPQGGVWNAARSEPGKRGFGWVEGWRGDVFVALETGADGKIRRCHPRDPSWMNWPLLEHAIIDNIVPDFPLINKSFNLSYAGPDL